MFWIAIIIIKLEIDFFFEYEVALFELECRVGDLHGFESRYTNVCYKTITVI
jgi:hypothetical protein